MTQNKPLVYFPIYGNNSPQLDSETLNQQISENKIEWMTTEEAAAFLRISPNYLRNLTSLGKVKYYKFGRRNRFLKCDLNKLLLANPRGDFYGR